MLKRIGQLKAKWGAWKAIDDSGGECTPSRDGTSNFAADAARELDAVLREAGAAERKSGEGRLRWRVLEAISSGKRPAPVTRFQPWMKPALAGVVAVIAFGAAGAMWMANQPTGPASNAPLLAIEPPSDIDTIPETTPGILDRINRGAQAANETRYFVQDVKAAWSFFRTQVVSFPVPSRVIDDAATQIPSGA